VAQENHQAVKSLNGEHFPRFRIAIVGSGAIGCYGGKLASFGRVHFNV
jgi:hypothetical protein